MKAANIVENVEGKILYPSKDQLSQKGVLKILIIIVNGSIMILAKRITSNL